MINAVLKWLQVTIENRYLLISAGNGSWLWIAHDDKHRKCTRMIMLKMFKKWLWMMMNSKERLRVIVILVYG